MSAPRLSLDETTRRFRRAFALVATALLAVPLLATILTTEVNWGPGDFLLMGGMLALLGGAADMALRLRALWHIRAGIIAFALAAFLLVWAELAVGLFD